MLIGIIFAAIMIIIVSSIFATIEYRAKKGNVGKFFYLKLLVPIAGIIIGSIVAVSVSQ